MGQDVGPLRRPHRRTDADHVRGLVGSQQVSLSNRPSRRRRHGAGVTAWLVFSGNVALVVLAALAITRVLELLF